MSKTLVIVMAVVALGLFAIAGSVIYATQQLKPLECGEGYRLGKGRMKGKCVDVRNTDDFFICQLQGIREYGSLSKAENDQRCVEELDD